jgi:murein DD-endopeptidase
MIGSRKMRSSFAAALSLTAALAIVLEISPLALARERGPRVEVVCPSAPIPARLAEKDVLVYELHITNFDVVPLTLKQVEVFTDPGDSQSIKTLSDKALSDAIIEVGRKSGSTVSPTIGPGNRAVLFMWVELAPNSTIPAHLLHRMVFAPAAEDVSANNPAESTLENFAISVNRDAVPVLGSPFDGGVWLAGDAPANDSGHRRSILAIDGHIYSPERFAIDWVKVGPNGDSHHDDTGRNENFGGYGEPIHAVAEGEVTQVVDGIPENTPRVLPQPITLDNIAGNYVVLRVAANRYVTYAHLQTGSIKVHVHDRVRRGDILARLGNTGQATGPHLHFQVTDGNSVLESQGVPFVLDKFTDLGPGSDFELNKHPSTPRSASIPGKDEVVEFKSEKK